MKISKVGVLGCGLMGSGIAQVCAQAGFDTLVREVNDDLIQKGLGGIQKFAAKMAERGQLKISADEVMKNLRGTTRLEDMADRDIIIEAVPEILDLKKSMYKTLSEVCRVIHLLYRLLKWQYQQNILNVLQDFISLILSRVWN